MKSYPLPKNEKTRLKELHQYNILDTFPEQEFNRITRIASEICNTPVSLMTLLDESRQWVKSSYGFPIRETPRELAICNYTILDPGKVLEVSDLRKDDRFSDNPLVTGSPNVVFYAGAPLITPTGNVLGSICVLDSQEKKLNDSQREALVALSQQVMNSLELRKTIQALKQTQKKLKGANQKLRSFAQIVSHDLKAPIANISMLIRLLQREHVKDVEMGEIVKLIDNSSSGLLSFIDGVLNRSKKTGSFEKSFKIIDSQLLVENVIKMIAPQEEVRININNQLPRLKMDHSILQQVFHNLISNAIKYNDKNAPEILIKSYSNSCYHSFIIADNGLGISSDKLDNVFHRRSTCHDADRFGNKGTGLGLYTVKSLLEEVGGKIEVASELYQGSEFTFHIPVLP